MSANNMAIIVRRGRRRYEVYLNGCVDNEYYYKEHKPLHIESSIKNAFKRAHELETEYGVSYIDDWERVKNV